MLQVHGIIDIHLLILIKQFWFWCEDLYPAFVTVSSEMLFSKLKLCRLHDLAYG
jgi:hypothetical protein